VSIYGNNCLITSILLPFVQLEASEATETDLIGLVETFVNEAIFNP